MTTMSISGPTQLVSAYEGAAPSTALAHRFMVRRNLAQFRSGSASEDSSLAPAALPRTAQNAKVS